MKCSMAGEHFSFDCFICTHNNAQAWCCGFSFHWGHCSWRSSRAKYSRLWHGCLFRFFCILIGLLMKYIFGIQFDSRAYQVWATGPYCLVWNLVFTACGSLGATTPTTSLWVESLLLESMLWRLVVFLPRICPSFSWTQSVHFVSSTLLCSDDLYIFEFGCWFMIFQRFLIWNFADFLLLEVYHLWYFILAPWSLSRGAQMPTWCGYEDRPFFSSSCIASRWNWSGISCTMACNGSHETAWHALQVRSRSHHSRRGFVFDFCCLPFFLLFFPLTQNWFQDYHHISASSPSMNFQGWLLLSGLPPLLQPAAF